MSNDVKERSKEAAERVKKEYRDSIAFLRRERDELNVQMHLANAELRDQWHAVEHKWEHFQSRAEIVGKASEESAKEIGEATKLVGEELKSAYCHIRNSLRNKP